jgi:hypothetical protein
MDRPSRTAALVCALLALACASGPEVRPGYDAEAEYEEEILAEIEWLILEGMKQARSPREGLPLGAVRGGRLPPVELTSEPTFRPDATPEQVEAELRYIVTQGALNLSRAKYYWRLEEAERRYPDQVGKYVDHLVLPLYLGGRSDWEKYRLPAAYSQLINDEFQRLYPPGKPPLKYHELQDLFVRVYVEHPIPQRVGITKP